MLATPSAGEGKCSIFHSFPLLHETASGILLLFTLYLLFCFAASAIECYFSLSVHMHFIDRLSFLLGFLSNFLISKHLSAVPCN